MMKKKLLFAILMSAMTLTPMAAQDEQTSAPVINVQQFVEPYEQLYQDPYSDNYIKDYTEYDYLMVDIENTDEDDVTIYYRITTYGEPGEWREYEGYPLLFYYEPIFEMIEAYAQADGKLASEINSVQDYYHIGHTWLATFYCIDGYCYINHESYEYDYSSVEFASDHPFIGGLFNESWDYNEPSSYSGEVIVPDRVTWSGDDQLVLTVEGVDYRAFANSAVTRVVLPNTILKIDNEAFYGCERLTSLELPNSVSTIGEYAFADCIALTSIVIPGSLHYLENDVFSGCTALTSVEFHNAVYSIEERAFSFCTGLTSLELPSSLRSIYESAFYGCTGLTSVTIPSLVSTIGSGAFIGCTGLTELLVQAVNPPRATRILGTDSNVYNSVTLFVPNESLEAYQAHEEWGKFTHIVPFIGAGPGDVDGDGRIDISDVTNLIDQVLSGQAPAYCDVDGDGKVNISDLTVLIDMILTGKM